MYFMTPENYWPSSPKLSSRLPLFSDMYLVYIVTIYLLKLCLILFSHLRLHNCEYLYSFVFLTNVCANPIYSSVLFAWPILLYLICSAKQYTVHEAAICRTPQTFSFTGNGKTWPIFSSPTNNMLCFYENIRELFFWRTTFWQKV